MLGTSQQKAFIKTEDVELVLGSSPSHIAISDLHRRYNLTVTEFFLALANNALPLQDKSLIEATFDIRNDDHISIYQKDYYFAFSIVGAHKRNDRIYLTQKNSNEIYLINGEFDQFAAEEILSSLQFLTH
ncbi:hypothetical protein [Flocculibacter collagenilyticus]|uniref:hypothetical protein n=1 Tax=Flocculibacter collagenilyticus TaxID=2744479 RepID=UPI0018F60906|nr:hypothetical protein [Flocculibacter collagenilyticus]